ncbi:MAG: hypothetical protein ACYCQK_01640 [Acidiferrobacteraceae bacterium]
MALLTTQTITRAGLTPSFAAASSGGDQWAPTSTTFLAFKNGSGAAITVTITTTAVFYGQPLSNVSITVDAGAELWAGPFDPGMVQAAGSDTASMTYSSATSLSVAAVSCPAG